MQTFAEWGVDSVAVDFCGNTQHGQSTRVRQEYAKYANAIAKSSNPSLQLAICNLGLGRAWTWAPQLGAPLFRLTLSNLPNLPP